MITPKLVDITLECLSKGGDIVLTDVRDDMEYVDEKPTGKRLGTRYEVAFSRLKPEKTSVKVPDTAPAITKEDIAAAEEAGLTIVVTFEGFTARFYKTRSSNEYALTAKAEKIIRKDKGK